MKKLILMLLNALVIITFFTACNKTNDEVVKFKETIYTPESDEQIREEVLSFLEHTDLNRVASKTNTTYIDREVGEAKWVMEGASNYIKNVNLGGETDEVEAVTIFLNTQVDSDGQVMIDGQEIITKFNFLMSQINEKEVTESKLAKIVDYEIVSITGSQVEMSINTYYKETSINQSAMASNGWPVVKAVRDNVRAHFGCQDNATCAYWSTSITTPINYGNYSQYLYPFSTIIQDSNGNNWNELPMASNWGGLNNTQIQYFADVYYTPSIVSWLPYVMLHYNNNITQELFLLNFDMRIDLYEGSPFSTATPGEVGFITSMVLGRGLQY